MEIRLLGPVHAEAAGQDVDLGRPRQRCVWAVLVFEANRVVPIDTLIDRVWGEGPPVSVRNVLYGYVTRLRAALRRADADSAGVRLDRASGGYMLRVPVERVDVYRFRELVGRARAERAGDDEQAAGQWERALELWRGEPLAGLTGPWAQGTRARLESEHIEASLQYHEVQLRRARHREILPGLREAAAGHPLDERMAGQLLTALHRCGMPAEALQHYEQLRKRLAEELGVAPGPELRTLHRLILRNDPVPTAPARPAPPLRTARPGPAGAGPIPAELPHTVAGFTGRTDELARLHALLPSEEEPRRRAANTVVVSAIGGAAGIGKTALAVHWAHQVRDRFPDGQIFVNLRGFDHDRPPLRPHEALELLLRSLGLAASEIPSQDEAQARVYRTLLADRRVLVVLDNAASAEQVRPLLPAGSSCCVVVTSRNRLGDLVVRDGARSLPLDLLLPAESRALLGQALGAARLSAEPVAADELIRLCGGLPLALRVAAARLAGDPGLSLADLAGEMAEGNRLEALDPEGADLSPLRAAFCASYRVLTHEARRLFRLLGLFPGSDFSTEAAAALMGSPLKQARRMLGALAAAHLIESGTAGRYRFHDLLSEYAQERARAEESAADRDAALERLLIWYVHAARAASGTWLFPEPAEPLGHAEERHLPSPAGAAQWLEEERRNLLAVVQHAVRHGPRPVAWHLTAALFGHFWLHLPRATWQATVQTALEAATAEGDPYGEAAMHSSLGIIQWDRGNARQALYHHARVRDISRELGWATGEAAGLGGRGLVEMSTARLGDAHEHFTAGLRTVREAGNLHLEALALVGLGGTCRDLGRLHEAAAHLEQAISRNAQIGWRDDSLALQNLGGVYWELGRLADGLLVLGPGTADDGRSGYRNGRAMMLDAVAKINMELGHHREALEQAERALAMVDAVGRRWIRAGVMNTVAAAHRKLARFDAALRAGTQALALAGEARSRRTEADGHLGLALTHHLLGQDDEARRHAGRALALAREHAFRVVEGQALTVLCELAGSGRAESAAAVRLGREALAVHRQTGHRLGEARTLAALSRSLRARGDAAAGPTAQEARRILAGVGVPENSYDDLVRP
ncbi:BTAD domain-containing putative transcriptional regulator [Streptomyces spororaveus]|uniref:SARP family transcriptional regulator n=1 Tax=Streptomyces spororaveus TaxID=284039 RepID=A0ABQ3T7R0_9ACTN|nr:BTAD domain-containing putative transcriptional regulator [Streptomyces spororaveus]GHI76405.1 SARP family transcriptional regulator [Streptomyces spororaveus]